MAVNKENTDRTYEEDTRKKYSDVFVFLIEERSISYLEAFQLGFVDGNLI